MIDSACPIPIHGVPVDCGFVNLGYFKIIILGMIQGITELLPISSTAHLRIIPALFGWTDPGTPFTGAVQLASFFAVIVYFRQEISSIIFDFLRAAKTRDFKSQEFRLGIGIFFSTFPVVVCALLLKSFLNQPNSPFRSLYVVGVSCIVMGGLLLLAEKWSRRKRGFQSITLRDGILVGCAQAFAIIPGVSRSGSTLTAALFLGLTREAAAAFSFILGIPVILGAGLKEMHELYKAGLSTHGWNVLCVGLLSASFFAFVAVYSLMHYLERRSTALFAWYRLFLGGFLIIGAALGLLR